MHAKKGVLKGWHKGTHAHHSILEFVCHMDLTPFWPPPHMYLPTIEKCKIREIKTSLVNTKVPIWVGLGTCVLERVC